MPPPKASRVTSLTLIGCCWAWFGWAAEPDFSRDIQPILSDACYQCHGPDASQRSTDFRLDTKQGALDPQRKAIVPGDASASDLVRRVRSDDPDIRMPPPDSTRQLSADEKKTLADWIDSGAKWQQHWAFIPAKRPEPPSVENPAWCRNPIDHFILSRLEQRQWQPSPEASKATLIRRVTLDLTGLPPTLEEVDAFLQDRSPDAFETVVRRLLKSPRYGERMASMWLDAARYADTSGYQNDGPREMWRYRDWVIEAFNDNMPFDKFTTRQIAGDLLLNKTLLQASQESPGAKSQTLDQHPMDYDSAWRGRLFANPTDLSLLIPSAFNRNHRGNAEGGIIAEEFQAEYVVDRVDTTATVWLGLTLGCCRCHDHKYDPFSQREYYQLYAYFNNLPEYGRAIKEGNSPPYITAPTRQQQRRLRELQMKRDLAVDAAKLAVNSDTYREAYDAWRSNVEPSPVDELVVVDGIVSRLRFDEQLVDDIRPQAPIRMQREPSARDDGEETKPVYREAPQQALGQHGLSSPDRSRSPKALGQHGLSSPDRSRSPKALGLNGVHVDLGDFADFGYFDSFTLSAWVYPTADQGTIISRMTPGAQQDGYYLHLEDRKVQLNLVKRWLDDSLRVESEQRLPLHQWTHVLATYDGSRYWRGVRIYLNGKSTPFQVKQDFINQTFAAKEQPVRVGDGAAPFRGGLDDVRIYRRVLSPEEAAIAAEYRTVSELVRQSDTDEIPPKARKYFNREQAPAKIRKQLQTARATERKWTEFRNSLPSLMVMQEMAPPRQTHILVRGQHDNLGDPVNPGLPGILPPLREGDSKNRLSLAKWLVQSDNPLTPRVLANRLWQLHFGVGLVKTAEDFGVQGERPTHPLLLDYLATELVQSGWDVKHLHELIVTSATYRQSSAVSTSQREQDPENRLLGRGPRHRLSAEMVRDQMLAVSGLVKHRLGGPSVLPYQPEGLWKEIATDTVYNQSHGDDLYRRSLYTYWKRTVAPPTMMTLDAVSRESCIVQRARTNTPLQALALMNEVSFVEGSRALAARVLAQAGRAPANRVTLLFRLTTSRYPTLRERRVLEQALEGYLKTFKKDVTGAQRLVDVGESAAGKEMDPSEMAAYTMVASLVLNLDEVLSKE